MIQLTKSRETDRQTDRMWIFTTKTLLQNLQQTRNLEIVFARSFLQILWQNSCRKFSCENSCRKFSCENSRRKFKCKNSCREFSCENSCRKFICDDSCSRAMNCCPSLSSECLVMALRISRESENKGESRLRKLGRFFCFFEAAIQKPI